MSTATINKPAGRALPRMPAGPGWPGPGDDGWAEPTADDLVDEHTFAEWAVRHDVQCEWDEGEVIFMPPASDTHDAEFEFVYPTLTMYVRARRLGQVRQDMYLRLPGRSRLRLPDLMFIAAGRDDVTIDRATVRGVPDVVVEIVSRDSTRRDYEPKYRQYERAGVPEYWVIDPLALALHLYVLGGDGRYAESGPDGDGRVHSTAVAGFWFRPEHLFRSDRPLALDWLRELGVV